MNLYDFFNIPFLIGLKEKKVFKITKTELIMGMFDYMNRSDIYFLINFAEAKKLLKQEKSGKIVFIYFDWDNIKEFLSGKGVY